MKRIGFILFAGLMSLNMAFGQLELYKRTLINVPAGEGAGFGNFVAGVDLDGDGKTEVYAVNNNWADGPTELIPRIYKFEQNASGGWDSVWSATLTIPKQNTWPSLTVSDLDGDGKKEITWSPVNFTDAATNPNPSRILVFESTPGSDVMGVSNGSGGYKANTEWTMTATDNANIRPFKMVAWDFDHDGKSELVFSDRANSIYRFGVVSVSAVPNDGNQTGVVWSYKYEGLVSNTSINAGTYYDFAIIDSTIFFINTGGAIQAVTYANGTYTLRAAQTGLMAGGSWKTSAVVDLDGAGSKELIASGWGTTAANKKVRVFQKATDSTLTEAVGIDVSSVLGAGQAYGGAVGDIDNDAKPDYVFGSRDGGSKVFRVEYQGGGIGTAANYSVSEIDRNVVTTATRIDEIALANVDATAGDEVFYSSSVDGLVPIVVLSEGAVAVNATFQVNMKIQMLAQKFAKATDYVVVRGNFQGWGGETHKLADGNNDSIYTGTFILAQNQDIEYKFVAMPGDKWENISGNRMANTGTSSITLPVVYFSNDSIPPVIGDNTITFQVQMNIQMREEKFNKNTDSLFVRGDFQGWGGYGNKLTDTDADSIYTGTFDVGSGTKINYKFVIARGGNDRWEQDPNRELTLTGSPQSTVLDWFDRDSVFSGILRSGNILYTVDLGPWIALGVFDKAHDTLFVHGAFNGWGHAKYENSWMQLVPGTDFYTVNLPTEGIVGEKMNYKFFVLYDLTQPGRSEWKDYFGWELPATVGGGNREIVYEGTNNQEIPVKYYNDVTSEMVIPSGTNVNVTFNMDLRPAMKAATTPFNKATDTLFFVTNWENWARLQGWKEGRQSSLKYSDADGDSIYTLAFQIKGPSPAVLQYQTEYIGAPAEGGGFDFGRYRTRYIRKTSAGGWPASYTFPTDVFTVNPPLVVEDPSVLSVKPVEGAVVRNYELQQNYPNPFNPSTTINYSIPVDGFVTLKIFNIIGQEVVTLVNENQKAGKYAARFDARHLASGVYIYRIDAGSFVSAKKMMLMK